jgi:plastocyanin
MACPTYLIFPLQQLLTLVACIVTLSSAAAAEVIGTVSVEYQGLFRVDTSVQSYPISVALFPGEGQRPLSRASNVKQIEIAENRMRPAFLTIQRGDRVKFVNHDPVFHQLFSLSPSEPVSVQLAKAGSPRNTTATMQLDQSGTTHVFCRIHNKSYARIDVVETPYLQTIQPGERFHFAGLGPGRWKLRLASPGAETQWADVMALTAPPARRFTLVSRGGGAGSARLAGQAAVENLYQH